MSDISPSSSYIQSCDVPTPVEVEQIPCTDSPLLSVTEVCDYYDFNTEDCSTMLDNGEDDLEQLSQLRPKGRRRKLTKLYECTAPGCNKSYTKPAYLTYHMDTSHLNLKWFTCIYKNCNKSFYYPSHMKRHLRTHGPKQFYCELCYNTFSRQHNLKVHQRKCRLLLMCSVCGETFITNADIQKHRQSHCVYLKCLYKDCYEHLPPENIREHLFQHVNVVKCPLCVAMFLEQSNLEGHMLRDHKTEMCYAADYTSDVDVESWFRDIFSDLQGLESGADYRGSANSEVSANSGTANSADSSAKSGTANSADSSAKSGTANSSGSVCSSQNGSTESSELKDTNPVQTKKVSRSNKEKKSAEPVKEDSKNSTESGTKSEDTVLYRCQEPGCNYSTPTPRWLTKHTLRHRKKDAFKCSVCNKVLADKWGLTLHMSSHRVTKDFTCSYCRKTYPSQSRLSAHCQKYHPESRVWKCEECMMSFSTSKRLMVHYRKHVIE
jgi:hypothetical protein